MKSLILESAFTSTKGMAKTLFPFMLLSPLLPAHYNNLKKITRINVPKLFVHGEDDEIVSFSMGQKLYQAAKAPKYFYPIKGAGHNDTYLVGGNTYFETLAAFVRDSRVKF
ncbi:MAG: alpha/beta hydrolase [Proteobacteria bacterium]|nr:alpha/beta hydrolase [Pseudomonadota bacterium]